MGWGLRIKNCIYGGSLKNLIFRVGSQKKKHYKRRIFYKWRAWTVCRFKRGLYKKGGVVEGGRGGEVMPKCTLWEIKL